LHEWKTPKSTDFSPDTKNNSPPDHFRQKKKGLMSPVVELSYAETTTPPAPRRPQIQSMKLTRFQKAQHSEASPE